MSNEPHGCAWRANLDCGGKAAMRNGRCATIETARQAHPWGSLLIFGMCHYSPNCRHRTLRVGEHTTFPRVRLALVAFTA
jgi:hypothetical protein